jgi:D-3-phosphoglycerate dehydrogenase / 2-oxoglutarate reductase
MPDILVTDSLFVGEEEQALLDGAGFTVERLDTPRASESELVAAIRGKTGYILGGLEMVSRPVIDAADALKAIAFTGSGYAEFIPAWQDATARGIAISAARGQNAAAVAEFALVGALAMVRNLPALTTRGGPTFWTSHEFGALTLGVVGVGHIGSDLARKARALGIRVIGTAAGQLSGREIEVVPLSELLATVDIVSVHVSKGRGQEVLDADAIRALKNGAVVVNAAFEEAINNTALLERVAAAELRAVLDYPVETPNDLPVGAILSSNAQTAFNTAEANKRVSQRATRALLNMLADRDDPDLVNPDYRHYR